MTKPSEEAKGALTTALQIKVMEELLNYLATLIERVEQATEKQDQFYEKQSKFFDELRETFFHDLIVQRVQLEDERALKEQQKKNNYKSGQGPQGKVGYSR